MRNQKRRTNTSELSPIESQKPNSSDLLKKISIHNLLNSNVEEKLSLHDANKEIQIEESFKENNHKHATSREMYSTDIPSFHLYRPTTNENVRATRRGSWSEEEKRLFAEGFKVIGKNWTAISKNFVKTRTRRQVGNYARKLMEEEEEEEE
eukprot:gene3004-5014_t